MNPNLLLKLLRKLYRTTFNFRHIDLASLIAEEASIKGQVASDLIKTRLLDDKPLMIARLNTELYTVLNYKENNYSDLTKTVKYINGTLNNNGWVQSNIDSLCSQSGFFPATSVMAERFAVHVLDHMKYVDIWGRFSFIEKFFDKELENSIKIRLNDIDPLIHENPWTEALKDKKVLVIHPFEKSIKSQYKKRKLLFQDERILPEFDLLTLKAVQTVVNTRSEYATWFDALESMKEGISKTDFDIALIGCGAYGMPLASYIKGLGKKAVQTGGVTQMIFGISGKRWVNHPNYSHLINEHWVHPLPEETPRDYIKIEGGCYW